MTEKDRRKAYEARMRERGLVKVTVWCTAECAERVRSIAAESRLTR